MKAETLTYLFILCLLFGLIGCAETLDLTHTILVDDSTKVEKIENCKKITHSDGRTELINCRDLK